MGLFTTKDRHEFKPLLVEIEDSPTSPLVRWLLWTVISFLVIAGLWLYFAKIDVVVSSSGQVLPDGEIKVVQPIETGVISKILVKAGDLVKKGQILMEIDPSVTDSSLASNKEHHIQLRLEILRLNALINKSNFNIPNDIKESTIIISQLNLYNTIKEEYSQQMHLIDEQLNQAKDQIQSTVIDKGRITQLLVKYKAKKERLEKILDIIAYKDYEEVVESVINNQEQISMKEHEISQAKAKVAELLNQKNLYTQQFKNKHLEELMQKRIENSELKSQINLINFKQSKQVITSPVDGYIGKLYIHTNGGVVTSAEKLMSIIPINTPLIVEAKVLNHDIGFIKEGMEVAVKVDTFTYQKYGLLSATVMHVPDDAIEDEKLGAVYEVLVKPELSYLEYQNKRHEIHAGMSVVAEMKVGSRRVIEFFIYPAIRYMDEGISVR